MKFVEKNDKCDKPIIRLLSALCKLDNRTVYCQNITNIARECDLPVTDVNSRSVKQNMSFANVPQGEEWRIDTLINLLAIKFDNYYLEDFSFGDINAMINYIATT